MRGQGRIEKWCDVIELQSRSLIVIATGYGLGGSDSIAGGVSIFSSPLSTDWPHIRWVVVASSLRVNRYKREADHWPPSKVEIKNNGAISPLPNTSSWLSV
jgi:hypothetical protein